jgi:hypothetical protein
MLGRYTTGPRQAAKCSKPSAAALRTTSGKPIPVRPLDRGLGPIEGALGPAGRGETVQVASVAEAATAVRKHVRAPIDTDPGRK